MNNWKQHNMTKGLNFFCSCWGMSSITQNFGKINSNEINSPNEYSMTIVHHKAKVCCWNLYRNLFHVWPAKSSARPTNVCKLIKLSSYPPAVLFAFHWGYLAVESFVCCFTRCLFMILLSKYETREKAYCMNVSKIYLFVWI